MVYGFEKTKIKLFFKGFIHFRIMSVFNNERKRKYEEYMPNIPFTRDLQ